MQKLMRLFLFSALLIAALPSFAAQRRFQQAESESRHSRNKDMEQSDLSSSVHLQASNGGMGTHLIKNQPLSQLTLQYEWMPLDFAAGIIGIGPEISYRDAQGTSFIGS